MSFLDPVVRLVGRLSFRHKMHATALVFGVPLLVALGVILAALGARVTAVGHQRDALAVQLPALTLLAQAHQYLAASSAWREGAEPLADLVQARRKSTQEALDKLESALAERELPGATKSATRAWLAAWRSKLAEVETSDADRYSELPAELRTSLRGQLDLINEGAGLLVDGQASSSRLLDLLSAQLPELIDTTGQAARLGAVVLLNQRVESSRRTELTLLRGNFNALVQWSMDGMQKVAREHPELGASLDDASSRLNTAFLGVQEAMTTKMLDTTDFDMTPQAFLALSSAALDQALAVSGILASDADRLLAARESSLQTQRNTVVAAMLLILALVAAGFVAAYISIMRGLKGLSDAANTMAAGDLSARVAVTSKDEIGIVGLQFNRMVESLAQRTELLREKTNDIQNMLQHMPQGILTIVAGGAIDAEYSDYLETIFATDDIKGRSAIDFLFADGNVGSDVLAQVEATTFACLGEDRMNFDFNAHLLVGEVAKTMADGRVKHLELSWSPICNEKDVVEKLMVCVRDVSELRVLEAKAEQQKRELQMIGQIVSVSQEKFHAFIVSARAFVAHNEALLGAADEVSEALVAQLFRNMHTIKGNARTYGLSDLTRIVHDAEQAYDALRHGSRFDKTALLVQLEAVMERIDEYAALNEYKLGRHGAGDPAAPGVVAGSSALTAMHRELEAIEAIDLGSASTGELVAALRRVRGALREIGSAPVQTLLAGVFDSLPSLAAELGKEAPKLRISDHGLRLRGELAGLLQNVFMHLCRNSIDHGIEPIAERFELGKHPAGMLRIDLALSGEELQIRLADDGRGLALGAIRRRAVERGLLAAGQACSDADLAELIFVAGFSTASAVTEVSGRGVGMDAVRAFVEDAGGKIALEFSDECVGAEYRAFSTRITLPGRYVVASLASADAASEVQGERAGAAAGETKALNEFRSLVAGLVRPTPLVPV